MSIKNKAILVALSVSQWTARKLDKKETEVVAVRNHASNGVARVNKVLLPGAAELDDVQKKTSFIRREYYTRTLPWADGLGIIKSTEYLGFVQYMAPHLDEWRALADKFVATYPRLIQTAQAHLNGLYNPDDYPDVEAVRGRFDIKLRYLPVPAANDWRVDVSQQEQERLRAQLEQDVKSSVSQAMASAWKRVALVIENARERLAQPDAVFRDTLVTNAIELCQLLPALNLTDDPALDAMRRELESSLCACHPDVLRHDETLRRDVARKLTVLQQQVPA